MPRIYLWIDADGEQKAAFSKPEDVGDQAAMFIVEYEETLDRPMILDNEEIEVGVDN